MYPKALGVRLLQLYEENVGLPRKDLRSKTPADPQKTDRELFMAMPDDDLWIDAALPEALLYLADNQRLEIPPSWHGCMTKYIKFVQEAVR